AATWSQEDDFPGRAGPRHRAAVQLGDHAGPHQRRLAAARGADHGQESVRAQQLQERRGLLLAAEEQVVLVAAKGAETRERVGTPSGMGAHHWASFDRWSDVRNPPRTAGSKVSPACRRTSVDTLLNRSFRRLNGGAR